MKSLVVTLFFAMGSWSFGQPSDVEITIREQIQKFEKALIQKDIEQISELLDKNLSMGHSNGWLETKESLVRDLVESKINYEKIEAAGPITFTYKSDDLIITRRDVDAYGVLNNISFTVKLNILEVWKLNGQQWQLLARQSVNRKL